MFLFFTFIYCIFINRFKIHASFTIFFFFSLPPPPLQPPFIHVHIHISKIICFKFTKVNGRYKKSSYMSCSWYETNTKFIILLTCYCFVQKYFFRATNGYQKLAILNRVLLHIFRCIISFLNDIKFHQNLDFFFVTHMKKYTVCNIVW